VTRGTRGKEGDEVGATIRDCPYIFSGKYKGFFLRFLGKISLKNMNLAE
jgi:hypothetical protein